MQINVKQAISLRIYTLLSKLCEKKYCRPENPFCGANVIIAYIQHSCNSNVVPCNSGEGCWDTHTYSWHLLDSLSGDSSYCFSEILLSSDRSAWGQALFEVYNHAFRWCSICKDILLVQKYEFLFGAAFLTNLSFSFLLVTFYTQAKSFFLVGYPPSW